MLCSSDPSVKCYGVLQKNEKGYYCEVKACTGDIKGFLLVNFGWIYIDKVHVILKYSIFRFYIV